MRLDLLESFAYHLINLLDFFTIKVELFLHNFLNIFLFHSFLHTKYLIPLSYTVIVADLFDDSRDNQLLVEIEGSRPQLNLLDSLILS